MSIKDLLEILKVNVFIHVAQTKHRWMEDVLASVFMEWMIINVLHAQKIFKWSNWWEYWIKGEIYKILLSGN